MFGFNSRSSFGAFDSLRPSFCLLALSFCFVKSLVMNVQFLRRHGGLRLLLFNTTCCVGWQEATAVATFKINMQEKPCTGSLKLFLASYHFISRKKL